MLQDVDPEGKNSMLVVSEFVGCSPSVSGAIRVNPWSIDSLADGIYTAIKMPATDRHLRHDKHWRYVSQHTVRFWAQVRRCTLMSALIIYLCAYCCLQGQAFHVVACPVPCSTLQLFNQVASLNLWQGRLER